MSSYFSFHSHRYISNLYAYLRYSKESFPKILEIVDRIKKIGVKHNATPGQVTLAWILAQGNDFVVIPGTKKVKVCAVLSIISEGYQQEIHL